MDSLSQGTQTAIKEATEFRAPHSFDNICPADGRVVESNNTQYLQSNADLFPFSEFLSKNTNEPFKHIDGPIKKPLLSKLPSTYAGEAVELFKIVLLLTRKNDLNQKQQNLLRDYIACRGISCRELRNEIVLQILHQTCRDSPGSLDPSIPSPPPLPQPLLQPGSAPSANAAIVTTGNNFTVDEAWVLLADCLSCFKPSFSFQNYILSYLCNACGRGYEVLCNEKLQQNCNTDEEAQRCYPPCLLEKRANIECNSMALKCCFTDDSTGFGKVTSWMVAEEFASLVLRHVKNLPSSHTMGWTVALKDMIGTFECQSGDFVLDLISEMEVPPSFGSRQANFLVTKSAKSSLGQYSFGNNSLHNVQQKRLLDFKEHQETLGATFGNKHFQSKGGLDNRDDASKRGSVKSATHWIDDVFRGALNNESTGVSADAAYIASKIKGGISDQPTPGIPMMIPPQVMSPYIGQPMIPMVIPNPQMMYQTTLNPAVYQPPHTQHADHLYLNPEQRKEAIDLRAQLEAKELEKRVLETTLQTEVLKQQIQDLKNLSAPQQRQQQVYAPSYQQEKQPRPKNLSPPPAKNIESVTKESPPSNRVSFKKLNDSKKLSKDDTQENEGAYQRTFMAEDTFRKIGRLGRIVWPPETQENFETKPKYNPMKLMIDEKKSARKEDAVTVPKTYPKPPIKAKPSQHKTDDSEKVISNVHAKESETCSNEESNLTEVKMKLEEIFSRSSSNKELPTPPVKDIDLEPQSSSKAPKVVSQKSILTYVRVDWELEIRKEFFSPQEKLNDTIGIELIYRQVVKDGLSQNCARLTEKCHKELRDVFGKLMISSATGGVPNEKKLLVIDMAKKLPFYFSKIYPVKDGSSKAAKIHRVAIGCEGVALLAFNDDLKFDVLQYIKYENITKILATSKTRIDLKFGEDGYTFYSPKAFEIQSLIEMHKKEKLELQNRLDDYMNYCYDRIVDTSFAPISSELSSIDIPKQFSPDDGIVLKVHAGSQTLLVEILPEMNVADVIGFVCTIVGLTSVEAQLEFIVRFEQGLIWTALMSKTNAFLDALKIFNVNPNKIGTNEEVGQADLLRGAWMAIINLPTAPPTYLDILYHQSITDYLCGYYLPLPTNIVPATVLEEISVLVALQFQIENPNSTVFEEGIEKYLPRNIWSMVDLEYLHPLIINQCEAIQKLGTDKKKSVALEILSQWPMFGSSFFPVTFMDRGDLKNECILAIHKHGIYLLNANTNVVMSFFSYKKGVTSTIDISDPYSKRLTIWIGGESSSSKPSLFPLISKRRDHIFALMELYNSLLV